MKATFALSYVTKEVVAVTLPGSFSVTLRVDHLGQSCGMNTGEKGQTRNTNDIVQPLGP